MTFFLCLYIKMKTGVKHYLAISIISITIIILYIGVVYGCRHRFNTVRQKHHIPNILDKNIKFIYMKHKQQQLLRLLVQVKDFLNMHRLPWWLMSGSLIGTKRHRGFIPWDDDIDMGMRKQDEGKLLELHNNGALAKYDLDLQKQIYLDNQYYHITTSTGEYCIDIFIFEEIGDLYRPTAKYIHREYFSIDELFPLRQELFHNVLVYVPHNYESYLDRIYPGWDKWLHIRYPHSTGKVCCFLGLTSQPKVPITEELRKNYHRWRNPVLSFVSIITNSCNATGRP